MKVKVKEPEEEKEELEEEAEEEEAEAEESEPAAETDNVGDPSVEINVEELIHELEVDGVAGAEQGARAVIGHAADVDRRHGEGGGGLAAPAGKVDGFLYSGLFAITLTY